jgi:hypothetical protein
VAVFVFVTDGVSEREPVLDGVWFDETAAVTDGSAVTDRDSVAIGVSIGV